MATIHGRTSPGNYYASRFWFDNAWLQYMEEHPLAAIGWSDFKSLLGIIPEVGTSVDAPVQLSEAVIKKFEKEDIDKQVTAYKKSIKAGHQVIVLAHSQGNFFTKKAYDEIAKENEGWMTKYFVTIGLASPSVVNLIPYDITSKFSEYYTFDNDPIVVLKGNGTVITNPMRHYIWQANPGVPVDSTTTSPCLEQNVPIGETPYCSDSNWTAKEVNPYGKYHEFTYYMSTLVTRDKVYNFITDSINRHTKKFSQWKLKERLNPDTKDYRITVEHQFDPTMTIDEELFPFDLNGKVYQVPDNNGDLHYVIAGFGGMQIQDETNPEWTDRKPDQFYRLKGTDPIEYIKSICDVSKIPLPKRGVVNVQLTWDDKYTDMNLEVDMPNGVKDIKDVCLPIEHFSVLKEEDIQPGVYKVFVRNIQGKIPSKIPQEVHLAIDTPTKAVTFDFNITSADMLNLGHVADIVITEQKEVKFTPTGTRVPPKITHYSSGGGSYNSYINYIYDIISRLKQGLLGPLSDAEVNIYNANNTDDSLYTTRTTGGVSALTAGVMYFPSEILNTLDDDKYYVVSVQGGDDIDTNDDGYADTNTTPNGGTIRAIIKGDKLKRDNFKVNILSEAVYQLSKDILNQDTSVISQRLKNITKRLLLKDVDGDNIINYEDILYWMPMYDKDKLMKDYSANYEPVAQKIYKNEDIYDDVYAIAYDIQLKDQTLHVKENSQADSIVGDIHVALFDGTASYSIEGDGSENFSIDDEGVVRVKEGTVLDYESKNRYTFKLSATVNGKTLFATLTINIDNELDAPELGGFGSYIDENSGEGTYVGQLYVNKGASEITDIRLQGDGSEKFNVNNSGVITVANGAVLDYESKREYNIQAVATNSEGESLPANIYIFLNDVPDAPTLQPLSATINENSPAGTKVGTLSINDNGTPITSVTLSGDGSEKFNVNNSGVITVAPNAVLDYETKPTYTLQAVATNVYGNSIAKTVIINLNNLPDIPPIIQPLTITIDENSLVGTKVGTLSINNNGSPITSVTLSGGGSEKFSIDNSGIITVASGAVLDYETQSQYIFQAVATNSFGDSIAKTVTISLNNLPDTPPTIQPLTVTIDENLAAGIQIGILDINDNGNAVSSVTLSGDGSEKFSVDNSGVIAIANGAVLDYETKSQYIFQAIAKNNFGNSIAKTVTINLNNLPDTPPTIQPLTLTIDKNVSIGTEVGILSINDNGSPITSITLNGSGSEDFSIGTNGVIVLVNKVNYKTKPNYIFQVVATNAYGGSESTSLNIDIIIGKPSLLGSYNIHDPFLEVALLRDNNIAYVASYFGGLRIIDVSNPTSPTLLGSYYTSNYSTSVTLSRVGDIAFLAVYNEGLKIIDISNPASPTLLGSYNTSSGESSVTLSRDGNIAFLATVDGGLKIIDVSSFTDY